MINGLNGQLNSGGYNAIFSVAAEVDSALAQAPEDLKFWEIDRTDLEAQPAQGTPPWFVWRAWWLMMGVPGVNVAVTHKVLHHKRPTLFPLLDNKTLAHLTKSAGETAADTQRRPRNSWTDIHDDLRTAEDVFSHLEGWFGELAARHSGVPISRLRIHDIVLWCDAVGDLTPARVAGSAFLETQGERL